MGNNYTPKLIDDYAKYTKKDITNLHCKRCGMFVLKERFIPCRDVEDETELKITCKGTGKIKGKTCEYCDGTGQFYPYVCANCDENMFSFEVVKLTKNQNKIIKSKKYKKRYEVKVN